ncbi:hypothetical protein [Alteraurantiacibacter buctensis]|uniref:Lipoprotein n=1 Tax=Alteraurantiacibacter buctensis TaxID=1503981 RepID=A0A844Z255_9SPHN|nr:hypothetical protein [Alteraurantiacibacter buctensis]MXO73428.1 hypothetical protein [Alteraurantiacibacter buctensis]
MERVGCIDWLAGRSRRWAVPLGAALVLAGCARDPTPAEPEEQTAVFTRADDLPVFTLEPVTAFEQDNFELAGDKRCSFATSPALPPLVLATGYLRRPQARVDVLVKYGGQVVEAHLRTPGGFDAITREATFDTGGMVIDVARIDVEPDGSGKAAPGRALLRVTMAGQEEQIIDGYWLCTA